jgi:hypothetical protein
MNGLVSAELASQIRGYPKGEVEKAKNDHAERLARIQLAQISPAARGNPLADPNPNGAKLEKENAKDTTEDSIVTDKTRGPNAIKS